jgi:hypothetical protein
MMAQRFKLKAMSLATLSFGGSTSNFSKVLIPLIYETAYSRIVSKTISPYNIGDEFKMSLHYLNVSSPIPDQPNYHPAICTLQTCPLIYAYLMYDPSLAGNALFLAIFSFLLPIQLLLGLHYRTSGVTIAIFIGLALEIIGYAGRIEMHLNPFLKSNFLTYLIPLTIGPVFLAAAVYLCLARIVVVYGEHLSLMRPRSYTLLFCCCDFLSLLLQAIGGAFAAMAETRKQVSREFCFASSDEIKREGGNALYFRAYSRMKDK